MNIVFTIVAAPLIGWFVRSRTGAVAICLAAQSLLFSFQTLAVLLAWMAGEGGFGGATEGGAFGPTPTGFPVSYNEADFWAYGLINLVLIGLSIAVTIAFGHLRARRSARHASVA